MRKELMPLINMAFDIVLVGVFAFNAAKAMNMPLMIGQLIAAACWAVLAVLNSGVLDKK